MLRAGSSLTIALLALAACGGDDAPASKKSDPSPTAKSNMQGVHPSIFECDSIVPVTAIAQAVGGEVETMDPMFKPPTGTPNPCDFVQTNAVQEVAPDGAPAGPPRMWSVRFDCREDFLKITNKEMERLVADEGANRVTVGKWGVEHRDAALLFIDDDAPCTVRIVGPGTTERTAIGRMVASKLTPGNAPMVPRPAPR